jgi:hypothetical protein
MTTSDVLASVVNVSSSSSEMQVRRSGHTVIYDNISSTFVIFGGLMVDEGGYDLGGGGGSGATGHLFSDLEVLETSAPRISRRWTTPSARLGTPQTRYWHTAVVTGRQMIVFGGATGEWPQLGNITDELWVLTLPSVGFANTAQPTWTAGPPGGVAAYGHTATLVGTQMYTIGGLDGNGEFVGSHRMARYDVTVGSWELCNASGTRPNALFGHSASYATEVGAIFVFGGYGSVLQSTGPGTVPTRAFTSHRVLKRNTLWIYSVALNEWRVGSAASGSAGLGRFLHSANIFNGFMIVYGGSTFNHNGPSYEVSRSVHPHPIRAHVLQFHVLLLRGWGAHARN